MIALKQNIWNTKINGINYLEAKYKEYNCKWDSVPEWKIFKNKYLVEAYNKDIQDPKMAKYWTTQKFIDFHNSLHNRVLDLEDNYELDDEDKYRITYLIENHEKTQISYEPYILVKKQKEAIYHFFKNRVMCLPSSTDIQEQEKPQSQTQYVNIYRKYNNCYDKEICICEITGKALKNIMRKIKSGKDQSDDNINYGFSIL